MGRAAAAQFDFGGHGQLPDCNTPTGVIPGFMPGTHFSAGLNFAAECMSRRCFLSSTLVPDARWVPGTNPGMTC
jgi:hypothetical protein